MKHAKGLFKRPIRSHWCVALGCLFMPSQRFKGFKVFKGLKRLEGLEGFKGLRAGKRAIFMSKCLEVLTGGRSMPGKCLRDVALGQLAGCEMGLTLESEEGEVPHLRWSPGAAPCLGQGRGRRINHGLLIRGYSSNSHDLILKWYLTN